MCASEHWTINGCDNGLSPFGAKPVSQPMISYCELDPWWRHQMETFSVLLALWCYLWCAPEKMVELTTDVPVIWAVMLLIVMSLKCPWKQSSAKFQSRHIHFHSIKWISNCPLQFCLGLNVLCEMTWKRRLHNSDHSCSLSGVPDYFGRNKISSGGDLSHYSSASLY